jgi:hypothetical protein
VRQGLDTSIPAVYTVLSLIKDLLVKKQSKTVLVFQIYIVLDMHTMQNK